MFDTLRERLFFWRKNKGLSKEELRKIQQEGDYLLLRLTRRRGSSSPRTWTAWRASPAP